MGWDIIKNRIKKELIIEKYGFGHAVAVLDSREIVDLFIDPPSNSNFYPPNTFVKGKIQRRLSKRGGYFVDLPNGFQGFLKSKVSYKEGEAVVLLSKVFFDEEKPQHFTDRLKITSKYFILKSEKSGFSFSNRVAINFNKDMLKSVIEARIKDQGDIFIICRSKVSEIRIEQFSEELKKIIEHYNLIREELSYKKEFYDGLAKKVALDKYDFESLSVIEENGIFERLGLWDKIHAINQKKYLIGNGPNLILEPTSSFFAIDVNSGRDLKIEVKELNLLASNEICRLTRILGFGGKIIIDFLPCSKLIKREIEDVFAKFSLDDNQKNKIFGWTKGGAFELVRERDKSPLKLLIPNN